MQRVVELVKPERLASKRIGHLPWWLYERARIDLYDRIRATERCFAAAVVTKYLSFVAVPTSVVFTHKVYVLTSTRWDILAVVQSTIHEIWARKYSGTLGQTLNYSPTDCFSTFAFPAGQWQQPNPDLSAIGERYHEHRRDLMLRLWLGLTDIYNLFHAPDLDDRLAKLFDKRRPGDEWLERNVPPEYFTIANTLSPDQARDAILELRALHRALDQAVLTAYAWHQPGPAGPAIDLAHDFQQVETLPENDRTRYTITPAARKELLTRLLKLNHQRAAEEAAGAATPSSAGFQPKKAQRDKRQDELL